MRILAIHMNSKVNGGAEVVLREGNHALAERGHQIALLSIGVPEDEGRYQQTYFELPEPKPGISGTAARLGQHFYNPASFALAQKAIREFKPVIVHAHTVFGYKNLTPSVLLPFVNANIPIVQTLHDFGLLCPASFFLSGGKVCEDCKGGRYYRCTRKRCVKGSIPRSLLASINGYVKDNFYHYPNLINTFVSPSNFLRDKYVEFGYEQGKILVLENAYFHPIPKSDNNGPKERNYILYAGRLSPEKGVDILLEAAKGLSMPIKIAGTGDQEAALRSFAKRNRLSNVEFLGHQDHPSIAGLYHNAAFTIFPSRWYENGPLAILESFAQATPVIGARMGAVPEFVINGETGYLFTPNDPEDLQRVINKALLHPDPQQMEMKALEHVAKLHSPERYAAGLEKIFEETVRSAKAKK